MIPTEPLVALLTKLLGRAGGGEPRQEGSVLVYPVRLTIRLFILGTVFVVPLMMLAAWPKSQTQWLTLLLSLVFVTALINMALPRAVELDEQGLHQHSLFGHKVLGWDQMHHLELREIQSNKVWYFRPIPRSGARDIRLSGLFYNLPHLVQQIRWRIPLPRQPYRKRHWYGN
jgi:hypothetical protein